ncbi:MAG: M48 family peptidase [Alphaproteobacteria bacterium]|nr:MAG: M48 family peptidase [Alphaproteobacteria bacterium]TAF77263.1 MAG: M48 family peptidase [Alphaproteobacteria bacterium]
MRWLWQKSKWFVGVAGICAMLICAPAHASLIRDAEMEAYLRSLSQPVFYAAGLSPEQVRMFVVNRPSINAFVAGGSNIFLHTGLIAEARTPEMLLGVIAHETGHITGGHLIRGSIYADQHYIQALITYVLGAAAVAVGGADAGIGILSSASHMSMRTMLAHTRTNERAADQAALGYFDAMGLDSEGMLRMFERLRQDEKLHVSPDADHYNRSHPLSQDRITHIRNHRTTTTHVGKKLSSEVTMRHQRVRAKLAGFLLDHAEVMQNYPLSDVSVPARMARAISYARSSYLSEAQREAQSLVEEHPDDPFLNELFGHVLADAGDMQKAAQLYKRAHDNAPDNALIASDYAKMLVATGKPAYGEAKKLLTRSVRIDPTYHQSWRLLAQIYGTEGDIGMAELSLAELAALNHDKEELLLRLENSERYIDAYSPEGIRMEDLRLLAKTMEDPKERTR